MLDNEYYSQELHGPYEMFDLGDFVLEEGGTIRGCKLAFATFGTLSPARDNAILVTTWFSGTNKIMEQAYIGPGRALDPTRYFIVVVNQIGNGLSSSPHNLPWPQGMGNFPKVRIGDDVRAQRRLLSEAFGIETLQLVTGASMGAQQTFEWAVRFPDAVQRAAPIAGFAKNTPHDFIFTETLCEAITSDPAWAGGWYEKPHAVREGIRRHSRLWAVMGFSPEIYKQELWRGLGFSSLDDFLMNFLDATFLPMDPNALLSMAWKWQRGDVSRMTGGNLAEALSRITAKTFVMPVSTDMFFTVADCAAEQKLIRGSELCVLETLWGHVGVFGMDPGYIEQVDRALNRLLASPV
ncbi:MAG: alpha/beta fold hydrolase [Pseudomonadota bacterium]|nr:alpha/beta fold hydrolase [Pseudomonadota bacterium]